MPILLTIAMLLPQIAVDSTPPPITETLSLETIMSDPAWIGSAPERPRWSADAETILFFRRRGETSERDVIRIDPVTGEETVLSDVEADAMISSGDWNHARNLMITSRNGDLVLFDRDSGESTQLTRTTASESRPRFLVDGRIAFERGGVTITRDLATGIEIETAEIRFEDEPEPPSEPEGLAADQRRIFEVLRDRADQREVSRLRRKARRDKNEHDVVGPIRLDPGLRSVREHLSPDGRWMLLQTASAQVPDSKADTMPVFVTEDGYVESERIRSKVGSSDRAAERLFLIDLLDATCREIDLDPLPERTTDRLEDIRAENLEWRSALDESTTPKDEPMDDADSEPNDGAVAAINRIAATAQEQVLVEEDTTTPQARPISINTVKWNTAGDLAAIQIRSHDNKDRWTTVLDPTSAINDGQCTLIEHLHDPAWIGWGFNEMGWLRDQSALWFLSEADGWSDLLIWRRDEAATENPPPESADPQLAEGDEPTAIADADADAEKTEPAPDSAPIAGAVTPLVAGRFEVKSVEQHPIDDSLWFISNRDDPSIWRLERVEPSTGWSETIVGEPGMVETYAISPDGADLLYLHSTIEHPAELHVLGLDELRDDRILTHSTTPRFDRIERRPPVLVDVPSRHGRPIRGRLHVPPVEDSGLDEHAKRPAVLFVHGAGYLQNAHAGWSRYYREGLFHDLLSREGFVVLDLDYRASAGYGRDWRTAIARDMGPAELDDLEDGIAWLAEHHDVDPRRVGVYGGSYGGFVTLMGLFTRPGTFACGAALRPVTDWAHYNDGYTRNILNTPADDPLAYRRSSPIEHAEGLADPLLICHGMVDDNVAFQDTVRLAQRLIELEKEDWEIAVYPIEAHGFREPTSWLDEYRRIRRLFRDCLLDNPR
jgi:acetyl esterase/lipase